jgi:hypothetical protein
MPQWILILSKALLERVRVGFIILLLALHTRQAQQMERV